jgi:glycosyltransferase involved in cell wall biosynthesis
MSSPRVVLAAPLYGNAEHLEIALASLLGQTFEDFRLLLVDDCSPDRTV